MFLAAALALTAIGAGCSVTGEESDRRNVAPRTTSAPSAAEATRAIMLYSRFNVATGRARTIDCTPSDGVTTCAVDYDDQCDVLAVTRQAGKLAVKQAGAGVCLHLSDFSTRTSTVP